MKKTWEIVRKNSKKIKLLRKEIMEILGKYVKNPGSNESELKTEELELESEELELESEELELELKKSESKPGASELQDNSSEEINLEKLVNELIELLKLSYNIENENELKENIKDGCIKKVGIMQHLIRLKEKLQGHEGIRLRKKNKGKFRSIDVGGDYRFLLIKGKNDDENKYTIKKFFLNHADYEWYIDHM